MKMNALPTIAAIAAALVFPQLAGAQHIADTQQGQEDHPPDAREEGFNAALQSAFPMTPDMVRRYRQIHMDNERAVLDKPEPQQLDRMDRLSLLPGSGPAPLVSIAPGIVSVIGFYDASGSPWPIRQYVIGDGDNYQLERLGEYANAIAISPLARVGWTNLVIDLEDASSPVVLRVTIDREQADYRRYIQIMQDGPHAARETVAGNEQTTPPDNGDLLAALSATGIPEDWIPVTVKGVSVAAWLAGDELFLRSAHALLSPQWLSSLTGPGRLRSYRLAANAVLLFSVDGRIVRAELDLP